MMNHREIKILLAMLLMFSGVIGIFYQSKTQQEVSVADWSPLQSLMTEHAVNYLSLLASSESVEAMMDILKGLPIEQVISIITELIHSGKIVRFDLIELLSAVALQYRDNQGVIDRLLPTVYQYPVKEGQEPILILVATSMYKDALVIWNAWSIRNDTPLLFDAYKYAVEHNRADILTIFVSYQLFVPAQEAERLLWRIIDEEKDAQFIPLLIRAGASVHARDENGVTFLIRAADHNNKSHVEALIAEGADVNEMPSPAIGTALQKALTKGHTGLTLFLRAHGARE